MRLSGYHRLVIFWFDLALKDRLRLARTIRRYAALELEERQVFPQQYHRFSPALVAWVFLRMGVDSPYQPVLGVLIALLLYGITIIYLAFQFIQWVLK